MPIPFKSIDEADIAREVVAQILESAINELGTQKRFAEETKLITPEFLSYIKHGQRMISLDKAKTIAPFLPLSHEDRESWLHYVDAYWNSQKEHHHLIQELSKSELENLINEISSIYQSATYNLDPHTVKQSYHRAMQMAEHTLYMIGIQNHPTVYLELSMLLQDVYSIIGRRVDALSFAKRSKYVCYLINPHEYPQYVERLTYNQVNVFRAEIVALHNLKRDEEAFKLTKEIENTEVFQRNINFWAPHLYRDRLNAMAGMARISINEAIYLAERVRDICQKRGDAYDPLLNFLIDRSLARVHISVGNKLNLKRGNALLRKNYDELNTTPNLGALHKVLFLRTYAESWWAQGDDIQGTAVMKQAVEIATTANLLHQLTEIEKLYETKLQK